MRWDGCFLLSGPISFTFVCFSKKLAQQECIPVGCVLPAHWPYLVVSATHAPPPTLRCTPPAMLAPLATHAPHAMHAPCHTHPHYTCPPCTHAPCTCFWKHYLAPTSLRAVIIGWWPCLRLVPSSVEYHGSATKKVLLPYWYNILL